MVTARFAHTKNAIKLFSVHSLFVCHNTHADPCRGVFIKRGVGPWTSRPRDCRSTHWTTSDSNLSLVLELDFSRLRPSNVCGGLCTYIWIPTYTAGADAPHVCVPYCTYNVCFSVCCVDKYFGGALHKGQETLQAYRQSIGSRTFKNMFSLTQRGVEDRLCLGPCTKDPHNRGAVAVYSQRTKKFYSRRWSWPFRTYGLRGFPNFYMKSEFVHY